MIKENDGFLKEFHGSNNQMRQNYRLKRTGGERRGGLTSAVEWHFLLPLTSKILPLLFCCC